MVFKIENGHYKKNIEGTLKPSCVLFFFLFYASFSIAQSDNLQKQTQVVTLDSTSISHQQALPSEAQDNAIIQIGIHLASYKKNSSLEKGWKMLKHTYAAHLTNKTPFYYQVPIKGDLYFRLVAGPFDSTLSAQTACADMKSKKQYCQVISYKVPQKN